jgi:hypothetical protein
VPITFFAHQAPVVPIVRRFPGRVDGVTLVIGSMAPDFGYVLRGTGISVWAHAMPWLVWFCVPVTLAVSWIIVRVLAPVVPDHLPQLASFRLRDYRGLATHRFSPAGSMVCAFIGAVTHVLLDGFTHDWGWFARNIGWYHDVLIPGHAFGRAWTVYRVVQYAGHVGLSALCIWMLWRAGRAGWMSARASRVPAFPATRATRAVLAITTATAAGLGAALVLAHRAGSATDVLRVAGAAFLGLTFGALALRRRVRADARVPAGVAAPG